MLFMKHFIFYLIGCIMSKIFKLQVVVIDGI